MLVQNLFALARPWCSVPVWTYLVEREVRLLPDLRDRLAAMGPQGWELVSILRDDPMSQYTLILKKPGL